MADEIDIVAAASACYGIISMSCAIEMYCKRQYRSMWVRPWIVQRPISGAYNKLFSDLEYSDKASFRNFIRMDMAAFEDLLSRVECSISKMKSNLRHPICPRERLCLTVRYLATGMLIEFYLLCRPIIVIFITAYRKKI